MSKQSTEDLIAEARQLIRHSSVSVPEHANMLGRLATALEAADQRADQAEATAEHLHDEDSREIVALTQERDQLAAVVEKALSHDPLHGADSGLHCGGMAPCIRDILATAPADALREVKADVWDEGAMWAAVECGAIRDGGSGFLTQGDNPYREEQT